MFLIKARPQRPLGVRVLLCVCASGVCVLGGGRSQTTRLKSFEWAGVPREGGENVGVGDGSGSRKGQCSVDALDRDGR